MLEFLIESQYLIKLDGLMSFRYGIYSQIIFGLMIALALASVYLCCRPSLSNDRIIFIALGLILVLFTALRPHGLTNDDGPYEIIVGNICPLMECKNIPGNGRDIIWFVLVGFLKEFMTGTRAFIVLSAVGVAIKLFAIDRLSSRKTFTLLLYVPLIYIQYDFTMVRSGLAISWFFLGMLFLAKGNLILGTCTMSFNGLVHAQATLSPFVLCFRFFKKRYIFPIVCMVLIVFISLRISPSLNSLDFLGKFRSTDGYYLPRLAGEWSGEKPLALAYILIVLYAIYICWFNFEKIVSQIVSSSVVLSLIFAWYFVEVPALQQRLLEFYLAPVVFLAGFSKNGRIQVFVTIMLSFALYLRIEILHDWILG